MAVPATVIISGQRKSVQHPLGGVVKHILVRDGQHVEAGEPLIRMEPTQARANVDSLLNRYANARLNQARLQAEYGRRTWRCRLRAGRAGPAADPRRAPGVAAAVAARPPDRAGQRTLRIAGEHRGAARPARRVAPDRGQPKRLQQRLLNSQLSGARDLAEEGYMPRNQLLEQERQLAEVNARLSESSGRFGQIRQSIAEAQMRTPNARRSTARKSTGNWRKPRSMRGRSGRSRPRRATNCATPRSARRSAATWPA
ncbi:biotin/lipoyl-binding protein [Pseudomonas aeruginosa]|nr:biotin/lipoyl-binding protein [Pseudomonas aeruginosa]